MGSAVQERDHRVLAIPRVHARLRVAGRAAWHFARFWHSVSLPAACRGRRRDPAARRDSVMDQRAAQADRTRKTRFATAVNTQSSAFAATLVLLINNTITI